jgi:hypothetical protein
MCKEINEKLNRNLFIDGPSTSNERRYRQKTGIFERVTLLRERSSPEAGVSCLISSGAAAPFSFFLSIEVAGL